MRALVTGAGGFVGHYLIEHLMGHGDEVTAVTFGDTGKNLPCTVDWFDIGDFESCRRVISSFKPEVIYHLAGISFVPEAEEDFGKALQVNVLGTSNIYRICHLMELRTKVIFISSAEVYGRIAPAHLPIKETTPIAPANNYSLSKAMAELVGNRYASMGIVEQVIIRPFNHIGPGQDSRFVASNFARQLAQIKAGKAAPVLSVGNLEARRDFTDVRDIVRAYRLAAVKGSGTYNLASGRSISIRSLLDLLITASGLRVEVRNDPARMRPAEIPDLYADISKARNELGWEPQYEIRDTLNELFKFWLDKES